MRTLARATLPRSGGDLDAEVVLRECPEGAVQRWVTHQHNTEGPGGYYWGHYHYDEGAAWAEFHERCAGRGATLVEADLGRGCALRRSGEAVELAGPGGAVVWLLGPGAWERLRRAVGAVSLEREDA